MSDDGDARRLMEALEGLEEALDGLLLSVGVLFVVCLAVGIGVGWLIFG